MKIFPIDRQMDPRKALIFFVAATILHCIKARSIRIQKRAAFYIANETACVVDNIVYYNGDPIPTDDPCEACKCRPPGFACVLRECEVKPGCRAVRRTGHCCPEYVCGCEHNGRMYRDGDEIRDSQNPCYTCHCQGSAIACAFVDCFFRVDCAPDYVQGECCPRYDHCPPLGPQGNESFIQKSSDRPTIIPTTLPAKEEPFTSSITTGITEGTELPILHNEVRNDEKDTADKPDEEEIKSEPEPESIVTETSEKVTEELSREKLNDESEKSLIDPAVLFYIPKEDSETRSSSAAEKNTAITEEVVEIKNDLQSESEKEIKIAEKEETSSITNDETYSNESSDPVYNFEISKITDGNEDESKIIDESEDESKIKKESEGEGESLIISEIHDAQSYEHNKEHSTSTTEKQFEVATETTLLKHGALISVITTTKPESYSTSKATEDELKDTTTEEKLTTNVEQNGHNESPTTLQLKSSTSVPTSVPLPVLLNSAELDERNQKDEEESSKSVTAFTESEPKNKLTSITVAELSGETKTISTESSISDSTTLSEASNINIIKQRNESVIRILKNEIEVVETEKHVEQPTEITDHTTSDITSKEDQSGTSVSEISSEVTESNESVRLGKIDDSTEKESSSIELTSATPEQSKTTQDESKEPPRFTVESTVQDRTTTKQALPDSTSLLTTDKQDENTTEKAEITEISKIETVTAAQSTTLGTSE